jgi:hypothetical protein
MARETGIIDFRDAYSEEHVQAVLQDLKAFEALVRADEREEFQRWFDAVTAQHKQEILAEREACAKACDWYVDYSSNPMNFAENCAQEIRNRGNT